MPVLIILAGIVLIIINYYAITKDKKSFKDVLNNQDSIDKDYDMELFAIRKDMAESILDLQKEIRELKGYIDNKQSVSLQDNINVKKRYYTDDIITEVENSPSVISEINYENRPNDGITDNKENKVEQIKAMIKSGYTDDDICEKLKIGKGEVLLIKGLFK